MNKTIFITIDHGLAFIYFFKNIIVDDLLNSGYKVVVLIEEEIKDEIARQHKHENLVFENLRIKEAKNYVESFFPSAQFWITFLRRVGASNKINTEALDSHIEAVKYTLSKKGKLFYRVILGIISLMRISKLARKVLIKSQNFFTPNIYGDLFIKYKPDLVISSSPGWRLDSFILREANKHKVPTLAAIIGWDNPSSYSLPGAHIDNVICWSNIQKTELMYGSDWKEKNIIIGGIPSYDGYINNSWTISRDAYFKLHNLDPKKKLISYAASFITFSPNIQNIHALVNMIEENELCETSQLLIRLHPNHFANISRFQFEKNQIEELVRKNPNIHLVNPASFGGGTSHYSGEDMDEKSSMLAHSDIFTTVYSTMVVEASTHKTPIISICIDSNEGWKSHFYLPLSKIGDWPTHQRFKNSQAGFVANNEKELKDSINILLENPEINQKAMEDFLKREITYVEGNAGKVVSENLINLVNNLTS